MASITQGNAFRYLTAVAFLGLLFSVKIDLGCFFIVFYFLVLSYAIFWGTNFVRQEIKKIFCATYISNHSKLFRFCQGRLFAVPISILITIPFSASLTIFVYSSDILASVVLVVDAVFFIFLYKFFNHNSTTSSLSEKARTLGAFLASTFVNASIMGVVYYLITYFNEPNFGIFDANLPSFVKDQVSHSCLAFQHIARTSLFLELNIFTFRNIPGISEYLFAFMYAFMFSITPFIGFSFFLSRIIDFALIKH